MRKKCPQCAEKVQREASVCRYCGHRFEAGNDGPEQRKRRRRWPIALAVLALLLAAGGGAWWWLSSDSDGDAGAEDPGETSSEVAAAEEAQQEADRCEGQLESLMNRLQELDSRLGVGVDYDEYGDLVGDASVEYDQISFGRLDPACVSAAGIPVENALNSYIDAANAWDDCFGDLNCSNNEVRPELQGHWADATADINKAEDGLRELAEP